MTISLAVQMFNLFIQGMGRLIPSILSAFLLYLYYDGAWTDPEPFILNTELALLWTYVIAYILWTIHFLITCSRRR